MKLIALLLSCACLQAFAYKPTAESLFRNGSNGEIGQNTVMATFVLKKKQKEKKQKEKKQKEKKQEEGEQKEEATETMRELPEVFTYKMFFSNESENTQLLQVSYSGEMASNSNMIDVNFFPRENFSTLRLGQEDAEKKFFYSIIASLMNNKGDTMISFLNDMGVPVQTNREKIDKEQLYYLGKYVKYLKIEEEEEREAQENPLEPADKDSAQKVKEIFKRPFLIPSPYVRRVKEGPDFFWVLESENVFAKFTHDDHKLIEMSVKTENGGNLYVKCFNYILHGQGLQFPELVLFRDLNGDEYLLNMKKITQFSDSSERFSSRISDFRKDLEKSQSAENPIKPSLTL